MDKALIETAAAALSIEAVYLRRSSIRCKDGFTPQFIEQDLSLIPQYRMGIDARLHVVKATQSATGDTFKTTTFFFVAAVRLIDGASVQGADPSDGVPEEAVYVEVDAEFCAQYRLNESDADEEALRATFEEFGRYNVGYHVWPYWREYVQGVCARIGIPPIPVPMYRIPQTDASEAPE